MKITSTIPGYVLYNGGIAPISDVPILERNNADTQAKGSKISGTIGAGVLAGLANLGLLENAGELVYQGALLAEQSKFDPDVGSLIFLGLTGMAANGAAAYVGNLLGKYLCRHVTDSMEKYDANALRTKLRDAQAEVLQ